MVMTLMSNPRGAVGTVVISTDGTGDYNCDGTDDDVEIQAAVDSLPAGGGCVYIKEGVYNLDATIILPIDNISIKGCGRSTQINGSGIPFIPLFTAPVINCVNHNGITIEDVLIIGNPAHPFNHGILFTSTTNSAIRNCWIEDCGEDGIRMSGTDSIITGNYVSNSGQHGIHVAAPENIIIINNVSFNNGDRGINITGIGNYVIVSNNAVYGNRKGIDLFSLNSVIVSNNLVYSNNELGIRIRTADYITVSNNYCYDSTEAFLGYGIWIEATSDYCNIEGNVLRGNNINIRDLGTNNQIFNNKELP